MYEVYIFEDLCLQTCNELPPFTEEKWPKICFIFIFIPSSRLKNQ